MVSVDLFIITMLLWFWCWDLPADLPSRRLVEKLQRPFVWLGLWHGWAMFALEPLHVNRRLKAMIHLSDGSVDEWRPIEPLHSNWFIDLLWFRQFKFQFAVMSGTNKVLWKPLCQWIVRQATQDGLTVQSIQLFREYPMVQGPTAETPLTEWKSYMMHEEKCKG